MGLDNGLGNGQPQPAALGLGGIEGLEDLIHDVGRNPLTAIADPHQHPVVIPSAGKGQSTPGRHSLDAILGDIQKHLAQQERIELDLREVGVQMHR